MRSSPLQVGSGFYKSVALGTNITTAVDPYGTLTAWGENLYGQTGTNNITTYSWTQLSNGDAHSLAIRSDNTLWGWGLNSSGQLGTSDTVARQSPTQISASIGGTVTSNFVAVSAGASHSVAIASDNVAYGWGLNTSGQVGDITVVSRSAPVQIGIGGQTPYYSIQFNGTNQYLSLPNTALLQMGSSDFTIEAWVYPTSAATSMPIVDLSGEAPFGFAGILIEMNADRTISVRIDDNGSTPWIFQITSTTTITLNTWNHIAVVRNGSGTNNIVGYINGVNSTSGTFSGTLWASGTLYLIGGRFNASVLSYVWSGNMSSVRIVKGTAVYTSNFTPSVSPFSNITNTSLLTGNAQTIIDGSSNNLTITNNNTATTTTTNNPFIYYSVNFNGTNQSIQIANSGGILDFGTGNFTLECWLNMSAVDSNSRMPFVYGNYNNGLSLPFLGISTVSAQLRMMYVPSSNSTSLTYYGSQVISANTWYHVAIVRSGNTLTYYINGSSNATVDVTGISFNSIDGIRIGGGDAATSAWNANYWWPGYISNFRAVKGTAVYTGNFTTPTNILRTIQGSSTNITALSGSETVLLTCQNSTFIDNSTNNFTITNNNSSVISSTIAPFAASPPAGGTGVFIANKISAGKDYTIAIKSDSTLWSWGLNTSYQLGSGTTAYRSSPVQIGTSSWSLVSAGASHVLAVDVNGLLYSWGSNNNGQAAVTVRPSWLIVIGSPNVQSMSAGIRNDNTLWTWGSGSGGVLGVGDTIARSSPVQIGTNFKYVDIGSATFATLFAIKNDGSGWASGSNTNGHLGDGTVVDRSSPVQIAGNISWSMISGGQNAVAGIDTSNRLYTWGVGTSGQLGNNSTTVNRSSPAQIAVDRTWSYVSMGNLFGLAITTSNTLYAWGQNNAGQIGDSTTTNRSSPVQIAGSWSSIYATGSYVVGIQTNGTLWGWGLNSSGQLGLGDTAPRSSPTQIGAGYSWTQVSVDDTHALFKRSDNTIWASGLNGSSQLGTGDAVSRSNPVQILPTDENWNIFPKTTLATSRAVRVSDGTLWVWGGDLNGSLGFNLGAATYASPTPQYDGPESLIVSPIQIGASSYAAISAGYSHSLALTSDKRLFTWGNNTNGQLGFVRSFVSVEAGNSITMALRSDGTLFTWGLAANGQLGDNTTVNKNSPILIGSRSTWSKITRATLNSYAINTLGRLYAWGDNIAGALGDSTVISRSSPIQIGSSSWSMVATGGTGTAGQQTTYAIRSDGRLFAWGDNSVGQRGTNDGGATALSPVQTGIVSWSMVSGGNQFALGITTDGKLYAWGKNNVGQLGITPSTFNWIKIVSSGLHTLALRNDNKLFSWGTNNVGQLGDGTTTNRSSPVFVAGGSYTQISAGISGSYAIRSDGSLWAWGENSTGNLGDGTTTNRSSPIQIGTSSWSQVSASIVYPTVGAIDVNGGIYSWGDNTAKALGFLTTQIHSANTTTYYLRNDGVLFGTGNNANGELGVGDTLTRSSPVQIGTGIASVGGTNNSSAYIKTDGSLWTWGQNTNGELGDGTTINRSTPVQIPGSWLQVSSGVSFALAIDATTNKLYGWGNNSAWFQLGNGTTINRSAPTQIGNVATSSWTQVSAGDSHALAISSNGTMWGWGAGTSGQIGDGTILNRSTPVQISGTWSKVSAGRGTVSGHSSAAISNVGDIYAWGTNDFGQLGTNNVSATGRSAPTQITAITQTYSQLLSTGFTLMAINSAGIAYGWGYNGTGNLGLSLTTNRSTPVQIGLNHSTPAKIDTTNSYTQISVSNNFGLALRSDKTLYSWGLNNTGQLGQGDTVARYSPVQVGTSSWNSISSGFAHAVAIRIDGALFAWGANDQGQLGVTNVVASGDTTNRSSPVQVGTTTSFTSVSAGSVHTIALRNDGGLFTWGLGNPGQLGSGATASRSSPVQVGTSSWSQVSAGASTGVGVDITNIAYAWGLGTTGQLGDGTIVSKSTPTVIGTTTSIYEFSPIQVGSSSWLSVSAGDSHTVAIKLDNTVFAWGLNSAGQLGDSTTTNKSSPVQVGTFLGQQISAGGSHSVAIDTSNKLYAWGLNTSGQLGISSTTYRSAPIQVGLSTNWNTISAGKDYTVALTNIGTYYGWGFGTTGQIGDATGATYSSPVIVTSTSLPNTSSPVQVGTSSYSQVSAGNNTSTVIDTNNKLYVWGLGTQGQLGAGLTIARSSPIQISTNSYNLINAGGTHTTIVSTISPQIILSTGLNTSGQLGDISVISRSSPTQIGASMTKYNSPVTVSVGNYSSYYVSSPTQVGTSSWTTVSAGGTHTLGVKNDYTLYSWGLNANGQLGISDTINRSSPVQIGSSSYSQVSAGDSHTVIAKSDGTINTFGLNNFGQLGDGT